MTNQSFQQLQKFAGHINSAYSVLNQLLDAIPKLFENTEVYVIDYIHSQTEEKAVEVSLDGATLCCLFTKNDVCNTSFLFLEDYGELMHYIDYFNHAFTYDYLLKAWLIEDYCIHVEKRNNERFFALHLRGSQEG